MLNMLTRELHCKTNWTENLKPLQRMMGFLFVLYPDVDTLASAVDTENL